MATQLLFYESVTPVSPQRHGNWSVESGAYFAFARQVNSVPLMAVEIPAAAREYSIVFAGTGESVMPVVILGIDGRDNLYVSDKGGWDATYIPAFVRRYPFVFSRSDDGSTFTLCLDESWAGCNQEDRGDRLFNADGERTPHLQNVLSFLQEYQSQFQRTQTFCNRLCELDLLEEMKVEFKLGGGDQRTLTGFQAVNRGRLKALSPEMLSELARSDELELIYTHLQSMSNFSLMRNRAGDRQVDEGGASQAEPEAESTATEEKAVSKSDTNDVRDAGNGAASQAEADVASGDESPGDETKAKPKPKTRPRQKKTE